MKRKIVCSLGLLTASLSVSCSYPTIQIVNGGLSSGNESKTNHTPFSYSIAEKKSFQLQSSESESVLKLDGHALKLKKNQICIALKDESKLEEILSYTKGRLIEQEIIPVGLGSTGSKEDGTARQLPPRELRKLPSYLIEVPESETEGLKEFSSRADQSGLTGKHEFVSNSDISLLSRIIDIRLHFKEEVVACCFNGAFEFASQSVEGKLVGTSSSVNFPSSTQSSWWVGGDPYVKGGRLNSHVTSSTPTASTWSPSLADGTGVIVAVIDTGFQGANEPYLPAAICTKMEWTWNTSVHGTNIAGHYNPSKPWHGRGSASLIFAPWNDQKGTLGAATDAQPLLIHTDTAYYWDIQEAIDTARVNNAMVINMSFGGGWSAFWSFITPNIQAANTEKRIMIAAAGNDDDDLYFFPSAYNEVMGIGAHDRSGQLGVFGTGKKSNTLNVDLYAPGILVAAAAYPDDDGTPTNTSNANWGKSFREISGSSVAAPIVSGVAAGMVEKGYIHDTNEAITYLKLWGQTYPVGKCLNAIYALI